MGITTKYFSIVSSLDKIWILSFDLRLNSKKKGVRHLELPTKYFGKICGCFSEIIMERPFIALQMIMPNVLAKYIAKKELPLKNEEP